MYHTGNKFAHNIAARRKVCETIQIQLKTTCSFSIVKHSLKFAIAIAQTLSIHVLHEPYLEWETFRIERWPDMF